MGMFDTVVFETPDPEHYDREIFARLLILPRDVFSRSYQTKALACALNTYTIRPDGTILRSWVDAEDQKHCEVDTELTAFFMIHSADGTVEDTITLALAVVNGRVVSIEKTVVCDTCSKSYLPSLGHHCVTYDGFGKPIVPWTPEQAASRVPAAQNSPRLTKAAEDVLNERQRQLEREHWNTEHDDLHTKQELADAAATYAVYGDFHGAPNHFAEKMWPAGWDRTFLKPSDHRRNCVKAAALLLAEIERIDRAAQKTA